MASLSRLTRYELAEASMQPTLQAGDWVIGLRRPFRIRRGIIATLHHPERSDLTLVKRVIGIAGDRVSARDGVLMVNGAARHEPYAIGLIGDFDIAAADGQAVVISDNRSVDSVDSRSFGPVPTASFTSRIVLRYHPGPPTPVR